MQEVRFLGRGGQGAVLAAELLAHAAFVDGKIPQSFPFFGVERRGAPVTAYARVSTTPIPVRGSIAQPDTLVVLDHGLLRTAGATDGLRKDGWLIVNAPARASAFPAPEQVQLARLDAGAIAGTYHLGSPTMPIVNTAVLGALVRLTGIVSRDALDEAIVRTVPRQPEENRRAARDGFDQVRPVVDPGSRTPPPVARPSRVLPLPEGPVADRSSAEIPTSSWRILRPEIELARCTRCNFCWKYCPDVAIELGEDGYPSVVQEHCKGCGICAEVCPPRTIAMVTEA